MAPTQAHSTQPDVSNRLTFAVRPRLLTLLGDQLIRDASLAVFELVKNAYDADATKCSVTLRSLDDIDSARITIQDDGTGMDETVLRTVWMVIATDYRTKQRRNRERTPRYGRFPLGEKGLGRLSIHKLGRRIRLTTRAPGNDELLMEFDWDRLEEAGTLGEAAVAVIKQTPEAFPGNRHGTLLEVSRLRESWTRGEVRRLHRAVNSLCSPFRGPADFDVELSSPGRQEWLEGLFTAKLAEGCALYQIHGSFEGTRASFWYTFTPPPGYNQKLRPRTHKEDNVTLTRRVGRKSTPLDLSEHAIGKVDFDFWLFDRDPLVMRTVTEDVKGLKDYLNENGGVRIYRDGIRVYDFGEPGNDWLNLDIRRVNTPTARTSNNQILGALQLERDDQHRPSREVQSGGFHRDNGVRGFSGWRVERLDSGRSRKDERPTASASSSSQAYKPTRLLSSRRGPGTHSGIGAYFRKLSQVSRQLNKNLTSIVTNFSTRQFQG